MSDLNEKKPKERNEIGNKDLKEQIADAALAILEEGTDYENLLYTKVQFGYLFDIEGHGIEALWKGTTDQMTAYFAMQGETLLSLNFSEALFQGTTETFLTLHG